jgi:hypothetical protein
VDDAAVVAGLVGGDARLLVEDDEAGARVSLGQGERRGEADDAAADDRDVGSAGHGPSI